MSVPLLVLVTDYGLTDAYVGQAHLAVHQVAPDARIVDLCHSVRPGNVTQAAYLLWACDRSMPEEAVICAVVDPGVGTARRLVAACRGDGPTYVAPDNGLLGFLRDDFPFCPRREEPLEAVVLESEQWWGPQRSATFHGRDILAPAAAYLAMGTVLSALGPALPDPPAACPGLAPAIGGDGGAPLTLRGQVAHVDRFGNAITNVPGELLAAGTGWSLQVPKIAAGELAGPRKTFGDVAAGDALWYVGSNGFVEIAVNQGRAADAFGLDLGTELELRATART